jgi:allophanate hydrolase
MSDATFAVQFAGPLVTIQDGGRAGNMRFGVAASGAMDRLAFAAAHAALGNPTDIAAIEISLGGLVLQCTEGAVTLAITGGDFVVEHSGQKTTSWTTLTVRKGEKLSVRAGKSGSWAYLAVCGDLQTESWLGSQATHAPSGFGGGALQSGQSLKVIDAKTRDDRLGSIARPDFVTNGPIRVVTGPQDKYFTKEALTQFVSEAFKVSDAYDRMGMRLSGPSLQLDNALSIPSEPIVRGSVQVSGDGTATVLLADHQTTGGYPKIATVISIDTDRISQLRAGEIIRFKPITSQTAIEDVRQFTARKTQYLAEISVPRGTLEQRLMRENLIHGCVFE